MPRPSEPEMRDVTDKELHRKEGVDPYPVPRKAEKAQQPKDDEATSTPENAHERGLEDEEGQYTDAVGKMQKTLRDEGDLEDWRKGRTQGAPAKKH